MTFFFLDGSALAKRYVSERGSPLVDHLFDNVSAHRLVILNVGFAEVVSVLVRRKNLGRISAGSLAQALLHLSREVVHAPNLRKIEPISGLVTAALAHIQAHAINATDAIGLHAALGLAQFARTRGDDLVLVASDQRLLRAAQAEGLRILDPEAADQAALDAMIAS